MTSNLWQKKTDLHILINPQFQAKHILLVIVAVFTFQLAALAQVNSGVATSNGVTIAFQDANDAPNSSGVTIAFQNNSDVANSNGATIAFQNDGGTAGGVSRSVTVGFGNRANPNFYLGRSPNSGTFADPVNTATGNFTFDKTDMTVAGKGFGFELKHFYNSQDSTAGSLGAGWTHSYNLTVAENTADNTATVRLDDGHEEVYDRNGANFTPKYSGIYNKLVKNANNTYTVTRKDRRKYNFNQNGKLTAVVDRNNNTQTLDYDANGRLSRVNVAGDRQVNFTYDANNRIQQVSDTLTPTPRTITYGYDTNNNLVSVTDANGSTTVYTYDANNQMLTARDGRGQVFITNVYDNVRRVVSYQTDAKGNRTDFIYDPPTGRTTIKDALNNLSYDYHDIRSRLIRREDRLGNSFSYTYDENNNRLSVTDKNDNPTVYEYDANGNVKKQTDAFGRNVTIVYDANDNPTSRTDELDNATMFEYDANGNLLRTTEPLNKITTFTYDGFGQLRTITDALNRTTTNNYDSFGNLISTVDALANTTVYAYDAIGRRISTTDARSKTTVFVYDKNGNLLSITDPLNGVIAYEYDANDNRTKITDARGKITLFDYDANNLLKKTTDERGGVTENFYDALDRRIAVKDARNFTTNFEYDLEARLKKIIDPLGNQTRYEYDANGNRTKATDPKNNAANFTFDALNRLTRTTDALGNQTRNAYDALGRLTRTTDAKGNVTRYFYDALGRLIKVTDADNKDTEYTFDLIGNRLTVKNPNNNTSIFTYDALNRLKTQTNPLNKTYTFTYDAVGNLTRKLDPNNNPIDYAYDGNNRLTRIDYPNSTFVSFIYDANGNRTQMTDSIGNSVYVYDDLNRLTNYTDAYGKTVGYEYDATSNRTALIYPDNRRVNYIFDIANRLTSATDWANRTTNYGYDATSLLNNSTNANGTNVNYGYDTAGRLISMSNKKSDLSVISSYAFTLDSVGNRTNVNQTEPLTAGANVSDTTYTYNPANQIQTAGATVFTSDDNGNLRTQTTGGVTTNFNYDFEDRLTSATNVATSAQYIYNGLGQRLARIQNGATTRFVLDPTSRLPRVLAETDVLGNITNYFTHGLGLIAKVATNGQAFQYHFDARGSVVAMTNSSQEIVNRYAYDPFGSTTAIAEQTPNPFRYIGQFGVTAEPFDLLFASRRFYNPSLGRFLTKDPAEFSATNPQTINEYVYSLNNPIVLIDPSGLSGERDGSARFEPLGSSDQRNRFLIQSSNEYSRLDLTLDFVKALPSSAKTIFFSAGKDVKNFIGCGGTGFNAEGACRQIGFGDFAIATGQDVSGTIAGFFGPAAKGYSFLTEFGGGYSKARNQGVGRREAFTQTFKREISEEILERFLRFRPPFATIDFFSNR